jgi:hypothetical protein
MDTVFAKIERAIEVGCKFIDANSDKENLEEIEFYVVSGIVVMVVSEYEQILEDLFTKRVLRTGDAEVCNYVRSAVARYFRSPDLSKIRDILIL